MSGIFSSSTIAIRYIKNINSLLISQEFLMLCNIAADISISGGEACVCSISEEEFIRFKCFKKDDMYEGWISTYDSDGREKSAICKVEQIYFPGLTAGVIANQIKDHFETCDKLFLYISKLPFINKREIFNDNISTLEMSDVIDQDIIKYL